MPDEIFPHMIIGQPADLTNPTQGIVHLRAVAPGLLVGNGLAAPFSRNAAVLQLDERCGSVRGRPSLRWHVAPSDPLPPELLETALHFHEAHRRPSGVLVQCVSGARAARLAYVLLRVWDGLLVTVARERVSFAPYLTVPAGQLDEVERWVSGRRHGGGFG